MDTDSDLVDEDCMSIHEYDSDEDLPGEDYENTKIPSFSLMHMENKEFLDCCRGILRERVPVSSVFTTHEAIGMHPDVMIYTYVDKHKKFEWVPNLHHFDENESCKFRHIYLRMIRNDMFNVTLKEILTYAQDKNLFYDYSVFQKIYEEIYCTKSTENNEVTSHDIGITRITPIAYTSLTEHYYANKHCVKKLRFEGHDFIMSSCRDYANFLPPTLDVVVSRIVAVYMSKLRRGIR
ncbi:hypothetical protein EBU95_16440 [bacterium]|uniref:Uncharacterized protein n=1 Tax=viral metagenome TaxID=1070528 RepID=A0A6C0EBU8_9ZZZZ|nr:hypothetical protein [bacterium]